MGVGKTTVAEALTRRLENSVMLDGDWCWWMHPWVFNDENRRMVVANIRYVLQSYIDNSGFETIIFCWVMDEQQIINDICDGLTMEKVIFICISLIADEATLARNFEVGNRDTRALSDSLSRLEKYNRIDSVKIQETGKNAEDVTQEILGVIEAAG